MRSSKRLGLQGESPNGLDTRRVGGYIFERTFDSGIAVPTTLSTNGNHDSAERPPSLPTGKLAHILRHAAQVFSDKGFEGASIRDISRSSGVSLSGLYYYFKHKQELLYLIQIHTFRSILAQLQERLAGAGDPVERMRILVRNHLEYFLLHRVEMKVLSHEDEALEGPYRKEVAEIKRRYYEIARRIFDDLRSSGRVRRLNPRVAVLTLFGMMNWVYTWHNVKVDPRAEALAETISGIFLEGVSSNGRPGRETGSRVRRAVVQRGRRAALCVRAH